MKLYQIVGKEHENTKGQKRNKLEGWHWHRHDKTRRFWIKEKCTKCEYKTISLSKVISA